MKKIIQISLIVLFIIFTAGVIYFSKQNLESKKINQAKASGEDKPEYQPVDNKTDPSQWSEFVHPSLGYSLKYPSEFQVEQRGKVGNLDDLVALNYIQGNKRLTVIKIQLTSATESEKISSNQKGQDNDGNDVIIYKKPFSDTKTISIIGTIYPTVGSDYRFEEIIQKVISTLK
jgi:hypothetical protein